MLYNPKCKYLQSVVVCSLTDSGQENIAGKLVFHHSLFLRRKTNHQTAKNSSRCVSGRRDRLIDWKMKEERREFQGDSGGGVKGGLLWEVIYKVQPAKIHPELNYGLF